MKDDREVSFITGNDIRVYEGVGIFRGFANAETVSQDGKSWIQITKAIVEDGSGKLIVVSVENITFLDRATKTKDIT